MVKLYDKRPLYGWINRNKNGIIYKDIMGEGVVKNLRRLTGLYALRRPLGGLGCVLLGQSLPSVARSHAKTPPHLGGLGQPAQTSFTTKR
jgi:hypothetical protein